VIDKINQNIVHHYNAVTQRVNEIAKRENLQGRYTSLFELYRISVDKRQDLDKLPEKVFGSGKQKEEQQGQDKK
jgi:hypothetical protein